MRKIVVLIGCSLFLLSATFAQNAADRTFIIRKTNITKLQELSAKYPEVKGIRFKRNFGKSAALHTGFQAASGEVVITMDADLQDNPGEIPELVRMIREEGYDMVSGWKKKRYDPLSKTLPSKFFNLTARIVTDIKLHDFNCGLKAYRKEVVKSIEVKVGDTVDRNSLLAVVE